MKTLAKILIPVFFPLLGLAQNNLGPVNSDEIRFSDQFRPVDTKSVTYSDSNDFIMRKPIDYRFVRQADVMWSKVTWEIIDLREKMNLPIYYPIDTLHNRKSLIMAVCDGIKTYNPDKGKYEIEAFKPAFKNNAFEFNEYISPDSLFELNKNVITWPNDKFIQGWKAEEITQILVKEVWYFDRKYSELRSEIIGLCFIREYKKVLGPPNNLGFPQDSIPRMEYLFWIYYPEARDYLAKIPVYNPYNSTVQYSFDDLLVNRRFKSYFVREENVYNDRLITDYATGREAQLESERIKKEIFDDEQDMWEN